MNLNIAQTRRIKRRCLLVRGRALLLLAIMVASSMLINGGMANPTAISVSPPNKTVQPGESFAVDITLDYAENLYGYEIWLGFDKNVLNAMSIQYRGYLNEQTIEYHKEINNVAGYVTLARSSLYPAPAKTGGSPPPLATVNFTAMSIGTSLLHLYNTVLSDNQANPIQHATVDGAVQVAGTVIQVNPQSSVVPIDAQFNVSVAITGVANLTAWQFKLFYRNTVLNCIGAVEGQFLKSGGETLFVKEIDNTYNSTHGRCLLADAFVNENVSVNGNGILAMIMFQAVSLGDSQLDLTSTKLSDEKQPPQPIDHSEVDGAVHVTGPPPIVSVSPQNLTGPPGWISINQTFTVNVTIAQVIDLHYWQVGMIFNPRVLQCISFTEGPFLRTGGNTIWQSGTIDNDAGIITPYGATLTGGGGVSGNGTLAYITFKVNDTGTSSFTLRNALFLDSGNYEMTPKLEHGRFELPSETPMIPTAYFYYYPAPPYVNETVTFDASGSSGNGGTITDYEWDFGDASQDHGMIVNHTYSNAGQYIVTLTVTSDNNLTDSYDDIVNVILLPSGPLIDIYTQRGGTGGNQPSDAFAPEELIVMTAYLTYNLAPIQNNLVAFHLYLPNGTQILTRTPTTNDAGLAIITYQVLAVPVFGLYSAEATAMVGGNIVTDVVQFRIGWLMEISNVVPSDKHSLPKNEFRNGEPFYVKLRLQNIRFSPTGTTLCISVVDEIHQAIIFYYNYCLVQPGLSDVVVNVGTIPMEAVIGKAAVYANALRWPGGPTFCPEKTAEFDIVIPHPDVAVFNVTFSPTDTYAGHSVLITVFVTNEYYLSQSFNVTVRSNNTALQNVAISNLGAYTDKNFTCVWDTYAVPPGDYIISANASIVPGETHIADNTYVGGIVHISQSTSPVHDLAITEVVLSKDAVGQGCSMLVNATAQNQGDFTETLNATVYANTTIVASITNISLTSGASTTITFIWNTTGLSKGNYTVTVAATSVPDENDTLDNALTAAAHWVTVSILGDITGPTGCPDGKVDARDVAKIASLFGIKNPNPKYDLSCDITGFMFGLADGKLDARDVSLVSSRYGQKDP